MLRCPQLLRTLVLRSSSLLRFPSFLPQGSSLLPSALLCPGLRTVVLRAELLCSGPQLRLWRLSGQTLDAGHPARPIQNDRRSAKACGFFLRARSKNCETPPAVAGGRKVVVAWGEIPATSLREKTAGNAVGTLAQKHYETVIFLNLLDETR